MSASEQIVRACQKHQPDFARNAPSSRSGVPKLSEPLPPRTPTSAPPFAQATAFGPWLAYEQRPATLSRAAACSPSVEPCLTESLPMSSALPRSVERLIEAFARLPGIGPKTASRLTYHLLRTGEGESRELAKALVAVREGTVFCSRCFNITSKESDPCEICEDPGREAGVLCVVEEPLDVLAIERTRNYAGRYHVLHGAISPVEGIGPDDLRIRELLARVDAEEIKELIVATNPTLEGEATAMYLKEAVHNPELRMTRLARGLPAGGDLEYADARTLSEALEGRREV